MKTLSRGTVKCIGPVLGLAFIALAWHPAEAVLVTNHFDINPNWTGLNNTSGGSNYGYTNTNVAGGSPGEVGGTVARTTAQNYYADTSNFFGEHFTLGYTLQGSGKFDAINVAPMNNQVQIGHRSTGSGNKSFVGLEVFDNNGSATSVRLRASIELADGTFVSSGLSVMPINLDSTFSYTYDPSGGVNSQGRLTLTVMTNASLFNTFVVDLTATDRATVGHFDAFGIGAFTPTVGVFPTQHGDVFIDDVIYSTIPEPTSLTLVGLFSMILLWSRRTK